MRIKLYENRDFMRRTQIKLMQEEVHIWCIRWKEVIRNGINCRLHLIKRHQKIVRLAFDLDLTMCDVLSFLIILRDLGEFYRYRSARKNIWKTLLL